MSTNHQLRVIDEHLHVDLNAELNLFCSILHMDLCACSANIPVLFHCHQHAQAANGAVLIKISKIPQHDTGTAYHSFCANKHRTEKKKNSVSRLSEVFNVEVMTR